jgi:hypothetical protein
MVIEYRVEIRANGVTITQHVEPCNDNDGKRSADEKTNDVTRPTHGADLDTVDTRAVSFANKPSKTEAKGGGLHPPTDDGGGGPRSGGTVIVYGPVVILPCPPRTGIHHSTDDSDDESRTLDGIHSQTDPDIVTKKPRTP